MWNIPDPDRSVYILTAPVSFTQDVNDSPLDILVRFIGIFLSLVKDSDLTRDFL